MNASPTIYRIVLIAVQKGSCESSEMEELYSTGDPRLALGASQQMQRLLRAYDAGLSKPRYFESATSEADSDDRKLAPSVQEIEDAQEALYTGPSGPPPSVRPPGQERCVAVRRVAPVVRAPACLDNLHGE
jgi:hypothetical protein